MTRAVVLWNVFGFVWWCPRCFFRIVLLCSEFAVNSERFEDPDFFRLMFWADLGRGCSVCWRRSVVSGFGFCGGLGLSTGSIDFPLYDWGHANSPNNFLPGDFQHLYKITCVNHFHWASLKTDPPPQLSVISSTLILVRSSHFSWGRTTILSTKGRVITGFFLFNYQFSK